MSKTQDGDKKVQSGEDLSNIISYILWLMGAVFDTCWTSLYDPLFLDSWWDEQAALTDHAYKNNPQSIQQFNWSCISVRRKKLYLFSFQKKKISAYEDLISTNGFS